MLSQSSLDQLVAVIPWVAFASAVSVFAPIVYRALRMRRPQIDHLAGLPFADETAARRHDTE